MPRYPKVIVSVSEAMPVLDVANMVGSAMIAASIPAPERLDFFAELMSGRFTKVDAVRRWVTVSP
jgi:hypothetical protein